MSTLPREGSEDTVTLISSSPAIENPSPAKNAPTTRLMVPSVFPGQGPLALNSGIPCQRGDSGGCLRFSAAGAALLTRIKAN
jgi:hypothetical protein